MKLRIFGSATEEQCRIIHDALLPVVGDVNGDGEVVLTVESALANNVSSYVDEVFFSDPGYDLFLVPAENVERYQDAEYFDDVFDLTNSGVLGEAGIGSYYACVIDWSSVGKGSRETVDAAYSAAQFLAEP